MKEIREGVISHPLVLHFWESHSGRRQEVLMRVVSRHLTALDRQITESVNILESGKVPEESLNSKNEWGGAKIPSLLVSSPKGLSGNKTPPEGKDSDVEERQQEESDEILRGAVRKGLKRLQYRECKEAEFPGEQDVIIQETVEVDPLRSFNPRKKVRGNGLVSTQSVTARKRDSQPGNSKVTPAKSFVEISWRGKQGSWPCSPTMEKAESAINRKRSPKRKTPSPAKRPAFP